MSAVADKCAMCGEMLPPVIAAYSATFKGSVCADCAECIRDAHKQLKHHGKRAEISGESSEPEKP